MRARTTRRSKSRRRELSPSVPRLSNVREAIQIYGGIGVTWECDAHLYLKRVHALRELFGGEPAQRPPLLATSTRPE